MRNTKALTVFIGSAQFVESIGKGALDCSLQPFGQASRWRDLNGWIETLNDFASLISREESAYLLRRRHVVHRERQARPPQPRALTKWLTRAVSERLPSIPKPD